MVPHQAEPRWSRSAALIDIEECECISIIENSNQILKKDLPNSVEVVSDGFEIYESLNQLTIENKNGGSYEFLIFDEIGNKYYSMKSNKTIENISKSKLPRLMFIKIIYKHQIINRKFYLTK